MAQQHPAHTCQICGKPLGTTFAISTVRFADEKGNPTGGTAALGFVHHGECYDKFQEKLKEHFPNLQPQEDKPKG
jgi:hypothetical protein